MTFVSQLMIFMAHALIYKLYMDLTASLAAILTTVLDPKNIFRFVEVILKNKVVLTKY